MDLHGRITLTNRNYSFITLRTMLVLITIILGFYGTASAFCPVTSDKCKCVRDTEEIISVIYCKELNQESFPPFLETNQSVVTLTIEDSSFFKMPSEAFKGLNKLRNLILNGLNIQIVEAGALKGLEAYLESIELRTNEFVDLPENIFFNFTHLKTVSLEGNQLSTLRKGWLQDLKSLEYLSLSGNKLTDIETGTFDTLTNLEILHLSRNQLGHLDEALFQSLGSLKELGLAENKLTVLPQKLIQNHRKLKWLDLTLNQLESLPENFFLNSQALTQLFLGSNQLTELKASHLPFSGQLQTLILSNNNISLFYDSTFQNVRNLKVLMMDHNNIVEMPELAFEYLETLETLSLRNNHIIELPVNNLVGLLALKFLDLHGNNIQVLTYGIFDPLGLLNHLDLSNNDLSIVQFGPFDALRRLTFLDLRNNALREVREHWFRKAISLVELYMDHNKIKTIEPGSFDKLTSIKVISLDYNYISNIASEHFRMNHVLKTLSISHNPLMQVSSDGFSQLKELKILRLNYTCMSSIPDGLFSSLAKLEELSLDHSPLEAIDEFTFKGLNALQSLHLGHHHNMTLIHSAAFGQVRGIRELVMDNMNLNTNHLSGVLYHLPNLIKLNLAFNELKSVQQDHFAYSPSIQSMTLVGNPLNCDCGVQWLRDYNALASKEQTLCYANPQDPGQLVVCFPLPRDCSQSASNPDLERFCQIISPKMNMSASNRPEIDYDHCVIPPDPTTTPPSTMGTTILTTLKPIPLTVTLEQNDTRILVEWDKPDHENAIGYRIRYRQFGTNNTKYSPKFTANDTSFEIDDIIVGVNYIICIDIRDVTGYYNMDERSCKELTSDSDVIIIKEKKKEDKIPWILIFGISGGIIVFLFILVIVIVCCLKNSKTRFSNKSREREDKDQMVRDKMGMWVNSFNFEGNMNEMVGEQLTMDFDIFSNNKISKAEKGKEANEHMNELNAKDLEKRLSDHLQSQQIINEYDQASDRGFAENCSDPGYNDMTGSEIAIDNYQDPDPIYQNTPADSAYSDTTRKSDDVYMY